MTRVRARDVVRCAPAVLLDCVTSSPLDTLVALAWFAMAAWDGLHHLWFAPVLWLSFNASAALTMSYFGLKIERIKAANALLVASIEDDIATLREAGHIVDANEIEHELAQVRRKS